MLFLSHSLPRYKDFPNVPYIKKGFISMGQNSKKRVNSEKNFSFQAVAFCILKSAQTKYSGKFICNYLDLWIYNSVKENE